MLCVHYVSCDPRYCVFVYDRSVMGLALKTLNERYGLITPTVTYDEQRQSAKLSQSEENGR